MIIRELIEKGLKNNCISIKEDWNGCIGICCRIGDYGFYFLNDYNADISLEEYWKIYTLEQTINIIYNILKDEQSAILNGIYEEEYNYYIAVLEENKMEEK